MPIFVFPNRVLHAYFVVFFRFIFELTNRCSLFSCNQTLLQKHLQTLLFGSDRFWGYINKLVFLKPLRSDRRAKYEIGNMKLKKTLKLGRNHHKCFALNLQLQWLLPTFSCSFKKNGRQERRNYFAKLTFIYGFMTIFPSLD